MPTDDVDTADRPARPTAGASPTLYLRGSREAAYPRCRRRAHRRTRSRALGRGPGTSTCDEVVGRRGRRRVCSATPGDGDWLDDLYVAPAHAGQGIGSALLDLVKAQRPGGFCLWVFESNTPGPRRSTPPRPRRARAHRRLRQRGAGARTQDGLAGRRPAGVLPRPDRRGRRPARRPARPPGGPHPRRPGPQGASASRDPDAGARDRRADGADAPPSSGAERLARIVHAIITESLDAVRAS